MLEVPPGASGFLCDHFSKACSAPNSAAVNSRAPQVPRTFELKRKSSPRNIVSSTVRKAFDARSIWKRRRRRRGQAAPARAPPTGSGRYLRSTGCAATITRTTASRFSAPRPTSFQVLRNEPQCESIRGTLCQIAAEDRGEARGVGAQVVAFHYAFAGARSDAASKVQDDRSTA